MPGRFPDFRARCTAAPLPSSPGAGYGGDGKGCGVGRDPGLDGVVDHFTLSGDEAGWLRNKTGTTRLGFAVQLKFLTWRGRFPRMRMELPPNGVEHVAKQVGVDASEPGFYDFTSRAAKRHRSEPRHPTGWHERTKTDLVKLVSHLVDVIWHDERREEQCGPSWGGRCAWT